MKIRPFLMLFPILPLACMPQKSMEKTLEKMNKKTVPYAYPEKLTHLDTLLILDARSKEEYDVSHLKGATWVGYKTFDINKLVKEYPKKSQPILVYCSIGVRSEDIGEKLQEAGYGNVHNLFGGIFEWKNTGNTVVDTQGNETEKIHAYNRFWGRLLKKGEKVY